MMAMDETPGTVPVTQDAPITYEQSLTLKPAVGDEIVDGYLRTPPAPNRHQPFLVETLRSQFFWQLDRRRYDIRKAAFALLIRREPLTYREPDLAIFVRDQMTSEDNVYVTSPPDLLVECFSKGHVRERLEVLLAEYASIGVPELWVIDMDRPMLHAFVLDGGELKPSASLLKGPLRPSRLNATIRVDTLWDALPPDPEA